MDKRTKTTKFRACCGVDGKQKHIGMYLTEIEAHLAYKAYKINEARLWYNRCLQGGIEVDTRVIERLKIWEF